MIHGEKDPVFPLDHGQALAAEIPNAEFLVLQGSGHLVLSPNWEVVVPAILRHTSDDSDGDQYTMPFAQQSAPTGRVARDG